MPSDEQSSPKQKLPIPLLLAIGGGLLLIITAVLLFVNNPSAPATPTASPGIQVEGPYPEVLRVSPQDAKAALDLGSATFVDVRGDAVYAIGHIPGALSIPLADIETRLTELDQDKWIITYCT
jgi:hypothetical protein